MRPRRANEEEGRTTESASWRAAKFAALFLLSFGVAFRLYASIEAPSSGPTVRQRSLREADAIPDHAQGALASHRPGSASAASGESSRRCWRILSSCKDTQIRQRPYGIDAGERVIDPGSPLHSSSTASHLGSLNSRSFKKNAGTR